MRTWPDDREERRRGVGCAACSEGRPDQIPNGQRVFAGLVSDAYLNRDQAARGYALVFWRGRHAADPTDLTEEEASAFASEVRLVSLGIERAYRPAKLNHLTLGNALPHLHTHIVTRYTDDPDPGRPPWFMGRPGGCPACTSRRRLRRHDRTLPRGKARGLSDADTLRWAAALVPEAHFLVTDLPVRE